MYVNVPYEDFKTLFIEIKIDPRDFKLKTILSPYSKQTINKNNIKNIPEIFAYEGLVNPLYENDFKYLEDLTKSKITNITKEHIEKKFPDKNILQLSITFLDATFINLPYFESMSDETQDMYFQSGYAINSRILISILVLKNLDMNDETFRIVKIFKSLSIYEKYSDSSLGNEYLVSKELTDQTEEEVENNFIRPVDYKYITNLEYRDKLHHNYSDIL